jgi:hypothetical protein
MAGAVSASVLQGFYDRLAGYVGAGEPGKAVVVCDKILRAETDAGRRLRVLRAKVVSLLQAGKAPEALAACDAAAADEPGASAALRCERAYALYRLRRDGEALAALRSGRGASALEAQLEAQLLHRTGDYAAALDAYERLVGACGGAGKASDELLSNLAAASVLAGQPQRFLDAVGSTPSLAARLRAGAGAGAGARPDHELLFNAATALLASRDLEGAGALLEAAESCGAARLTEAGLSAREAATELAGIRVQRAVARHLGALQRPQPQPQAHAAVEAAYLEVLQLRAGEAGDSSAAVSDADAGKDKGKEAGQVDSAVRALAANNLTALRGDRDVFDSYKRVRAAEGDAALQRLSRSAAQAVAFNRAALLAKMQKTAESKELLAELAGQYPHAVARLALAEAALLVRRPGTASPVDRSRGAELLRARALAAAASGDLAAAVPLLLGVAQAEAAGPGGPAAGAAALADPVLPAALRLAPDVVQAAVKLLLAPLPHGATGAAAAAAPAAAAAAAAVAAAAAEAYLAALKPQTPEQRLHAAFARAALLARLGRYAEAATEFEAVIAGRVAGGAAPDAKTRLRALAGYVSAAARAGDVAASEAKAQALPRPVALVPLDLQLLEEAKALQPPRRAQSANASAAGQGELLTTPPPVAAGSADKVTPRRSAAGSVDQAALRARVKAARAKRTAQRRAKRRECHLAKLLAAGIDPKAHKVDLERWTPLNMRAKAVKLRKKTGAKLTGAQGAGDAAAAKGANVLDVAQQDAAKAAQAAAQAAAQPARGGKKGRR